MSSGVWRDARDEGRECGHMDDDGIPCEWEGTVTVDFDREVHEVWWTCPACGTEHEEEWGWE